MSVRLIRSEMSEAMVRGRAEESTTMTSSEIDGAREAEAASEPRVSDNVGESFEGITTEIRTV